MRLIIVSEMQSPHATMNISTRPNNIQSKN